jgi:hypothetical protein
MTSFEDNTHVFIVRIWLEPREIEGTSAKWRGVIEHVPSGERRYVQDLDDIIASIVPYLGEMGVRPSLGQRLRQWLKRWKRQTEF